MKFFVYKITLTALLLWLGGAVQAQLKYYDAAAYPLLGKLSDSTEGRYARLPVWCKGVSEKAVWRLGQDTPGLAIRFSSDSPTIGARWTNRRDNVMSHMAPVGIRGLDLYTLRDGQWRYVRCARPKGHTTEATIISNMRSEMREYMLYLPLYDGVTSLEIGIEADAVLRQPAVASPVTSRPVICYGTSITQGGCATRPGMVYTSILGRMLNREVVNLGFSGRGHLEYEVAELMTRRDPALIVMDFIPNVSAEMLRAKIDRFMHIIKDKLPDVPILFVEHVPFPLAEYDMRKEAWVVASNAAQYEAYRRLKREGMKHLYYFRADQLIGDDGEGTVDGEHFTDLGFYRCAQALYPTVKRLMR